MIQPWKKVGSKPVGDFRIFKIRSDTCINPRTGQEHDFFVLDSVNWVNVIAVTPDQQLVMVRQYRHGSGTVELEIPGGMMDPHETDPGGDRRARTARGDRLRRRKRAAARENPFQPRDFEQHHFHRAD
jgi:hypothetical protein